MLDNKQWDAFQTSSGLRGDAHGCGGCMEMTTARIRLAALFDLESDNTNINMLHVLRVGKVPLGKPPPPHTAINNNEEPPRMTRAMREVKECLREATMSVLHGDETPFLRRWIRWKKMRKRRNWLSWKQDFLEHKLISRIVSVSSQHRP